jgi:DNA-binding PadR family transcriptional regulator
MSKPKLVVLGFLNRAPMHGYQIGQTAEKFGLPAWAGIKLPSIYKALQELEASKHIRGEQVTEGNNPPRTVFHLNATGRKLLSELILQNLTSETTNSQDWWLALSFSWHTITRKQLEDAIHIRLERMTRMNAQMEESLCRKMLDSGEMPFVHGHIMQLGVNHHKVELKTLQELLDDVRSDKHEDYYTQQGDIS